MIGQLFGLCGELAVVRMEAEIFVAHVERITAVMRRRLQADHVVAKAGTPGEAMVVVSDGRRRSWF